VKGDCSSEIAEKHRSPLPATTIHNHNNTKTQNAVYHRWSLLDHHRKALVSRCRSGARTIRGRCHFYGNLVDYNGAQHPESSCRESTAGVLLPPSNRRIYQQYSSAAFFINEKVSEEVLRACQKRMYVLQSLLRTITILHQNIQGTYTVDTSMVDTTLKVDFQIPITYPDIHPSLMYEWVTAAAAAHPFALPTRRTYGSTRTNGRSKPTSIVVGRVSQAARWIRRPCSQRALLQASLSSLYAQKLMQGS
jgi:hypothetical protein